MIKEAYVSFETAKHLKEKGFDWDCTSHFDSNHIECPNTPMNFNSTKYWVSRPTHQMACAWLREKHLIHVYAEHKAFFQEKPKKLYYHWVPSIKTLPHCPINKSGFPKDTIYVETYCDTYEEAVEAAIKYCLENLV